MGPTEHHHDRPPQPAENDAEIRASDEEREAVADALRAQCAAGRLQVDELEHRLAATFAARTVTELEHLVRDLPSQRPLATPARPSAPSQVKPGLPGLRSFRQVHEFPTERELCFRQAINHMLPVMVAGGFDVVARTDLELLAFQRDRERVVVAFSDSEPRGTRLVVQGIARRRVRRVFAQLSG